MNKSNVSGDSKIVMGTPIARENSIDIPPKTAATKIIEEGEITLNLEPNTPDLIAKLNKNNKER